jgi:hypothetical protein
MYIELTRRRESKHPPPHQASCGGDLLSELSVARVSVESSVMGDYLQRKIMMWSQVQGITFRFSGGA